MNDQNQHHQNNERQYRQQIENLSHHRLHVWHKARQLVRLVCSHPIGDAELRLHASKAAKSVGLNTAEGSGLDGAARKKHYKIARGSVIEVVAAYELAADTGETIPLEEVSRLGAAIASMLSGLIRK